MARKPREVAEWIGKRYLRRETFPEDPDKEAQTFMAFDKMGEVNRELFHDIPVGVLFEEEDPYDSYQNMADTVAEEGILRVFDGGDPHPIWDHEAEIIGRAVHDWYGHLTLDVPFTATGEYRKWEHARNHYPVYCERVLFTEVVGQLGAAIHLEDGFADDRFEQKVFPAPAHWIDKMALAVEEAEQ